MERHGGRTGQEKESHSVASVLSSSDGSLSLDAVFPTAVEKHNNNDPHLTLVKALLVAEHLRVQQVMGPHTRCEGAVLRSQTSLWVCLACWLRSTWQGKSRSVIPLKKLG